MQDHQLIGVLKTGSMLVAGFGIVIAMASYPPTAGLAGVLLDLILWPLDGAQAISGPEMRLLAAVAGGVMVGWGLLLWLVAARLFRVDPELARTMILASIGVWFVVDSAASFFAGAPLNVALNTGFLVLFAVPVLLHRRSRAVSTLGSGT